MNIPVMAGFSGRKAVYDVEAYPNFVLYAFQDADTGEVTRFVIDDTADQRDQLRAYLGTIDILLGYNSAHYDSHLLEAALEGVALDKRRSRRPAKARDIWQLGDNIITGKARVFGDPLLTRYGHPRDDYPLSIDLAGILHKDGKFPALKQLGVQYGYPVLQDLPIAPGTTLTDEQKQTITDYNQHDLAVTRLVLEHADDRLEMRRQLTELYHTNLMSVSDAKLGETVIVTDYERQLNQLVRETADGEEPDYERVTKPAVGTTWQCTGTDILNQYAFTTPDAQALYARMAQQTFIWRKELNAEGKTALVAGHGDVTTHLGIGGRTYTFGFGGLHSQDEPLIASSDADHVLVEFDVASFYPALIVARKLAPRHLERSIFLDVFDRLRQQRLAAKRAGNKTLADGLKIAINAVFGKQSDVWGRLLDPRNGLAITLNGQFTLIRLIERLAELDGVTVLTANTDGVRLRIPRTQRDAVERAVQDIADAYQVSFEAEEIERYYAHNINNYLAVYADGTVKTRGAAFNENASKGAKKVIRRAIREHLVHDTPVEQTVKNCTDLNMFLDYHRANSGFVTQDGAGTSYQQTNRWYESTAQIGPLYSLNTTSGRRSKIGGTVSVRVVNNLPETFPADLNHQHYIDAAHREIAAIRHPKPPKAKTRAKSPDLLDAAERAELASRQTVEDVDLIRMMGIAPHVEHYRDDYLNRYRGNYYDSMFNVLIAMWRNPVLGLTKAELIWLMDSFDSAPQYFQKAAKRKDILKRIQWMTENVIPFQKNLLPPDDQPGQATVNVLSDEPGGGKTRQALRMIVSNGPEVYWWALNKIDPLAGEREAELRALAAEQGVLVDFKAIHCQANGLGTMLSQIDERVRAIAEHPARGETIFVTLVTHKTLLDNDLDHVSGVLLVDEPIECWQQVSYNFARSHRTLRELVEPEKLPAEYDGDVNPAVVADTQAIRLVLTERGWETYHDKAMATDTVHGSYNWLIRQAAHTSGRVYALVEQWNELAEDGHGDLDVLSLLHPRHVGHFKQTWMMAAHFDQLIVYELWSALYDIQWNFVALESGWKRSIPLAGRVTLYYALEHRQVSATYLGDERHCRALGQAVAEFYGDSPYIWSTNQAFYDSFIGMRQEVVGADGQTYKAYLTPKANGINAFQNVHGAAWLASIKLKSSLLSLLRLLWPGDAGRMALVNYELYSALQFLARGNSRRFDSLDQVRYIVADREQADYVARLWQLPAERVQALPMRPELKEVLDDTAPKRGRRATLSDDERRERRRRLDAKRRAALALAEGREPGQNGRPKICPEATGPVVDPSLAA